MAAAEGMCTSGPNTGDGMLHFLPQPLRSFREPGGKKCIGALFAPPLLCSCREPGVKKCTFCHRAPEIAHRPRGKNSTWFAFFRVRFGDQARLVCWAPTQATLFGSSWRGRVGFCGCVRACMRTWAHNASTCVRARVRAYVRARVTCTCVRACVPLWCACVCVCVIVGVSVCV